MTDVQGAFAFGAVLLIPTVGIFLMLYVYIESTEKHKDD